MQLQTDDTQNNFFKALGISEDRSKQLIMLVKKTIKKDLNKSASYKYLADKCQNIEEYTFCASSYSDLVSKLQHGGGHPLEGLLGGLQAAGMIVHIAKIMGSEGEEGQGLSPEEDDEVSKLIKQSFKQNGEPGKPRKDNSDN